MNKALKENDKVSKSNLKPVKVSEETVTNTVERIDAESATMNTLKALNVNENKMKIDEEFLSNISNNSNSSNSNSTNFNGTNFNSTNFNSTNSSKDSTNLSENILNETATVELTTINAVTSSVKTTTEDYDDYGDSDEDHGLKPSCIAALCTG